MKSYSTHKFSQSFVILCTTYVCVLSDYFIFQIKYILLNILLTILLDIAWCIHNSIYCCKIKIVINTICDNVDHPEPQNNRCTSCTRAL